MTPTGTPKAGSFSPIPVSMRDRWLAVMLFSRHHLADPASMAWLMFPEMFSAIVVLGMPLAIVGVVTDSESINGIEANKRADYKYFHQITTRWMDNDVYGHVNNVVYYSWFDTVVNQFLIDNGALDIKHSSIIGLVIETQCNYFAPVAFPERVTAGMRVARIGKSSVRYEIGIFRNNEEQASAQGHFIHVYVDRESRRPSTIPDEVRSFLQSVQVQS